MLGEFLDRAKVGGLVEAARRSAAPQILFVRSEFTACYNKRPFLVRHRLAEDPHFTFESLFELCRRHPSKNVHVRVGPAPVDAQIDSVYERFGSGLTLEDAIADFEGRNAYICIDNPERDPEYRPVIEALVGEIAAQSEELEPGMNWFSTYVFMSAQDAVTPYHMDREMNFLLQIVGTKLVKLWDPHDEAIMTSAQKDLLLSDSDHPRPGYLPSFEDKAMRFDLAPGLGVHHPFIAPHLVTTLANRSISLAITFRTGRSETWSDAHRFNQHLRKLGLSPAPVGPSIARDTVKARVLRLARGARSSLRRRSPTEAPA